MTASSVTIVAGQPRLRGARRDDPAQASTTCPSSSDGRLVGMITAGDLMRLEQANPAYPRRPHRRRRRPWQSLKADARPASAPSWRPRRPGRHRRRHRPRRHRDRRRHHAQAASTSPRPSSGTRPSPYCWVALGSQGRLETGLQSDQDNAIIIDDAVTARAAGPGSRSSPGGRRRPGRACGYRPVPRRHDGDQPAVAGQPLRRCGAATSAAGSTNPSPTRSSMRRRSSTCVPCTATTQLFERLQRAVLEWAPRRPVPGLPGQEAQRFQPPIGFFRDFVLEDEGEHKNTLDLKAGGHHHDRPDGTALCARRTAHARSTRCAAEVRGVAGRSQRGERREPRSDAFEFINYVRIRHQVRQIKAGQQPDNHVAAVRAELVRKAPPARRVPDHPQDAGGARLHPPHATSPS